MAEQLPLPLYDPTPRTARPAPHPDASERQRRCQRCGREIPPGSRRRRWCSQACVDEQRLDVGMDVAEIVERRDHGVCALCGRDCARMASAVDAAEMRAANACLRDTLRFWDRVRAALRLACERRPDLMPPNRVRYWDVDHAVPLRLGGSRQLHNLRTLCCPCHRRETARLRRFLADHRPASEWTVTVKGRA